MEPIEILKDARKAVPAVKFATGIAGVAAAVAIVVGVIKDIKVAVFGSVIMLGLMFILLTFSSIARRTTSNIIQVFAHILAAFFVLMIMATTFLLFTSVFWSYPRPVDKLFDIASTPTDVIRLPPKSARAEADLMLALQGKVGRWVDRVFTAQAGNGGIKDSPSAPEATSQAWTTAQCLTGVLSTQIDLASYVVHIKNAFNFIESKYRSTPQRGWNLHGNNDPYTVTEIGGWVTIAYIKSLDSRTSLWGYSEREDILRRIERNLTEIIQRQDDTDGWRPVIDNYPGFTRTYPTVVALWSLIEARSSPTVSQRISGRYDERIRRGINWLLRTYNKELGWLQNPNRIGQVSRFDGLTAQTLFVLSCAETLRGFEYLKNEESYKGAKKDFINNKHFAKWRIDRDNSSISDADQRFLPTEFRAEGSTFLWFPWVFAVLTQLASDRDLLEYEREGVAQLRFEILSSNAERLDNYVEAANLSYLLAENLYCVAMSANRR